jgi:hypothetical protein
MKNTMKILASNRDLYDYLRDLSKALKARQREELSNALVNASLQSSMSTEFIGESQIALRQVLKDDHGVLSAQERSEVIDVLRQLKDAFESKDKTPSEYH